MKTLVKFALLAAPALLMFIPDMPTQSVRSLSGLQFVSEADAQYGRSRRTRRRGLAVGYAAGQDAAARDYDSTYNTSQPPPAPAPQPPAPAPQQSAPAAQ